jgi:hypothetical protein
MISKKCYIYISTCFQISNLFQNINLTKKIQITLNLGYNQEISIGQLKKKAEEFLACV